MINFASTWIHVPGKFDSRMSEDEEGKKVKNLTSALDSLPLLGFKIDRCTISVSKENLEGKQHHTGNC